ncbi:hypothetical protein TNCT_504111 [Trichonephila clavata]|uniref:Uncharacterized protein n=1 Tax=Trichonephila clavata TaxID=2740835 RepID=A0A8X6G345_TRICU|nr:hypothetical protein TNCT_504111 [Trichonephila clavata]
MQVDTTLGLEKNVWQLVTRFGTYPIVISQAFKKMDGSCIYHRTTKTTYSESKMDDGSEKELHFNKLRPYIARIEQIGLIFDQDDEFGELHYALLIQ